MNDLDRAFLLPTRVLDWTAARARALSTNIAHATQDGYRRQDVDFGELVEAVRAERDHGHAGAIQRAQPRTVEDRNAPIGANGNSVDFEREQVQIDKNALLHQLSTIVVNGTLETLRAAIRGQGT